MRWLRCRLSGLCNVQDSKGGAREREKGAGHRQEGEVQQQQQQVECRVQNAEGRVTINDLLWKEGKGEEECPHFYNWLFFLPLHTKHPRIIKLSRGGGFEDGAG